MTARTWLLGFLAIVLAGACLALPFMPLSSLPFEGQQLFKENAIRLHPSSQGIPLPAGLQDGDMLYLKDMDQGTRLVFAAGVGNPPAGTSLTLRIVRDGQPRDVTVQFVPLPSSTSTMVTLVATEALTILVAALGLLLLWRGSGRAAVGVAVWCFANVIDALCTTASLPLPYTAIIGWTGTVIENTGTMVGLFLVAEGLCAEAASKGTWRWVRGGFILVMALYFAAVFSYNGIFYATGIVIYLELFVIVWLHLLAFAVSLLIMSIYYQRVSPVNRARIRWVLLSFSGLLLAYVLNVLWPLLGLTATAGNVIQNLMSAAVFTGFAYAVLRHRLVSLQFVLNRALVYGLITSLVVGVFAALLAFLERNTLNSQTNQFLALLIPLVLGMGINTLKRKVDDYINRAFFRHRHKAEAALTQFARSCGFVEDPDKLLDLAAEELHRDSRAQGVAIYLTQKGKAGPKLVRRQGVLESPAKLGNDDLALLRLKSGDAEVDLHGTFTALAAEGYAYALAVRGELLGFIVVGPRPGEAYTPEERRLYSVVAQQVGVALHALRLQEQQKLLQDIAKGIFKSMPKARARAKALLEARAV